MDGHVALDKIAGWIRDISDEAGVSHGRRTFLNLQIEISQSASISDMWDNVCEALGQLGFDLGEMPQGSAHDLLGANVTRRTRTVVDNKGLTEMLPKFFGDNSRRNVERATARKWLISFRNI